MGAGGGEAPSGSGSEHSYYSALAGGGDGITNAFIVSNTGVVPWLMNHVFIFVNPPTAVLCFPTPQHGSFTVSYGIAYWFVRNSELRDFYGRFRLQHEVVCCCYRPVKNCKPPDIA